jgi:hypothetical protein
MKHITTYKKFDSLFEDVEAGTEQSLSQEEIEQLIKAAKDVVNKELDTPSAGSKKVAQAQAKAQSKPQSKPQSQNESYIFESNGEEVINLATMKKYADSLIPKMPILKAGDKLVKFGKGTKPTEIPAGAEYEAKFISVAGSSVQVKYKDRNGKFEDCAITYVPTPEELKHIAGIYTKLGKKITSASRLNKLLNIAAPVLGVIGFAAVLGGMFKQGSFDGSEHTAFREIPALVIAGAGGILAGLSGAVATKSTSNKLQVAQNTMSMFTALIKVFCESLGLNMMDIDSVDSIEKLLTMEQQLEVELGNVQGQGQAEVPAEVPVNTTTSSVIESRIVGFNKFK